MCEPTALVPPVENEETIPFFVAVNKALNDVDRNLIPPVETLHQRTGELVAAYNRIHDAFTEQARSHDLLNWLSFSIAIRSFSITLDHAPLHELRKLYVLIEQCGYPSIDPLISTRMIWSNYLLARDERHEAQGVVRRLQNDLDLFRNRHPDVLESDFEEEFRRFLKHHGL